MPQFFEWKYLRADGTPFDAEVSLTRIDIRGETYLQAIVRDVTKRKHTEEELRRLSVAIEQAAEEIIITDADGVIQYVNPAFETITGYPRQEAMGQTPRLVKSGVHDGAFYENLWDTIRNGDIWTGQITNRRKDGTLIEEDAIISPLLVSSAASQGIFRKRDITEEVKLHHSPPGAEDGIRQFWQVASPMTSTTYHGADGVCHYRANEDGKASPFCLTSIRSFRLRKGCDLTRSLLTFSRQQPSPRAALDLNDAIRRRRSC